MDKKYFLNYCAVLFHPVQDRENGFCTLVYNPKDGSFHKVNRIGYGVLKCLDEQPKVSAEKLMEKMASQMGVAVWEIERKIPNFINQMVKENVILESE